MTFNNVQDTLCGNKKAVNLIYFALCGVYDMGDALKQCKTLASRMMVDANTTRYDFSKETLIGYSVVTPKHSQSFRLDKINEVKRLFEFHKLNGDLI